MMLLNPTRYLRFLFRILFCLLIFSGISQAEPRMIFPNSVVPLPAPIAATQKAVKAENATEIVRFGVSLMLRDFPQMQERVARGEIISREELERVHLPLPQDYDAIVDWLKAQGLKINRLDPSRMLVFAQGTRAQVEASLQVHFTSVTSNGATFTAADSVPSLPMSIATPVLGINHLQPFLQRRKHAVRRPLTNNAAPFKVAEILKAYNGTNLGVTGAGQKIAILIDTTAKNSDLTAFWTNNGIAQSISNIENINVIGGTLPAASGEETLDVEWTSGIAPGAKIRVYASKTLSDEDLDVCLQRIIDDLPTQPQLHQLSISLGLGETYMAAAQLNTDAQLFATLASGGVSIFVSSGDDGSTPSDNGDSLGPLQVESYASDPSVTAVGGTSLFLNTSTGIRSSEIAWDGSGGGLSIHFNRPTWQTGTGVPAGTKRAVPDVCLAADPETGAYVYLNGQIETIGGTSWSAPVWAGFCALVNQGRANAVPAKPPLGLMNPSLYPLIGTNNFYDITSGTNSHTSSGANAGKYSCTTGYDLVTGVGAPNMANLFATLVAQAPPAPTITSFTPDSGVQNTTVVITGTNFGSASLVTFNGTSAAFTVNSGTQITAVSPVGATTGPLAVTTPGGIATSATNFTVIPGPPAPSITAFTPLYGLPGSTVTITGLNFTAATSVKINGVSAGTFTVNSATQVTAVVPAAATSGQVTVTTASGTATSSGSFTVLTGDGTPTLASFTPVTGAVAQSVTLTGTNFVNVTSVSFNGTSTPFTIVSPTEISTAVPTGASSGAITVVTGLGSVTSATSFTVVEPPSSAIVISQIYGAGGNSDALYANDYVELYNRSALAVSVAGWSVQYASRTGTTWNAIALSGTIQPGHHYLVKSAGGTTGAALPAPDATGSVNMSSTAGKVALMNSSTAIPSGTTSPVGLSALMDLVGYGAADAYEGSGPAPTISSTTAATRLGSGATDTGENSADFTAETPNPRNSSGGTTPTEPDLTIAKTHVGNFTQGDVGKSYSIIVTNVGGAATTGAVTVTDSLPAGLTATAISGTGWTTTLGTLTATRSDALAAGASYPTLTITVSVSASAAASVTNTANVSGGGETITINNTATDPTTISPSGGATGHVVISQVYGAGGNASAPYRNDFIELFNAGSSAVSLAGWSVQYASATGTSWTNITPLSGTLQPGRYYLVAESSGGSIGAVLPTADATGSISMSATAGKVALVNGTTALTGANPASGATVVDFVGYGTTANGYEGTGPAPAPSATNAVIRANAGATDTNNNAADFSAAAVSPRNSSFTGTLTPIESWRNQYFGSPLNSGAGADTFITAGDGLTNLIKYSLGLVPNIPATTDSKITFNTTSGVLGITITKNPNATDVTFQVESSDTMDTAGSWTTSSIVIDSTTSTTIQAHDTHPATSGKRFVRLKVTRP